MEIFHRTMKCLRNFSRLMTTVSAEQRREIENAKPFKSMPGPRGLPLIKNLWRYFPVIGTYKGKKFHRIYAKFYEEFGPVVREEVFGDRVIVHVYEARDMETVCKNEGRQPERMSHRILAKYRRERPDKYSCPGLFPSNGEEWFRFRSLFQKNLMAPDTGDICKSDIETITEDLIALISAKLDRNLEVDLQPLLFRWALECIGVVTVNRRLGCLTEGEGKNVSVLVEAVHNTHKAVFQTENSPLNHKKNYKMLEESQDYVSGVVEKYLDEAMEEIQQGKHEDSVLARMMKTENITKRDIFTMILDMFLAGIDTTSYALAFTFYNLAKNQEVQLKLRQLLMETLPEKHSRLSDQRARLPYLQQVIRESLRFNPISIGTGRIIPCDLVLGGYHVPAKTMVIMQHQVSSMLEKYFPDPETFRPERWAHLAIPYVYSPFGTGHRLCIGTRIARKELKLAVAKIIRNFALSYHHEDIDSYNELINIPDKPVLLRFKSLPR